MANYRIEGNRLINEEEEAQGIGCLLLIAAGVLYSLWQAIASVIAAFFSWLILFVKWFFIGGLVTAFAAVTTLVLITQICHWMQAWQKRTTEAPFRWSLGFPDFEEYVIYILVVSFLGGVGSGFFAGDLEKTWEKNTRPIAKVSPPAKGERP